MRSLEMNLQHQAKMTEFILETLHRLTVGHAEVDAACDAIRSYPNGLPLLADFVKTSVPPICIHLTIGVIRNLNKNSANMVLFSQLGVVHHVFTHLQKLCGSLEQISNQPLLVDGVSYVEIIENILIALHQFAEDQGNRAYMFRARIFPVLVRVKMLFDILSSCQ